jgi:PhoH-like ATPase
VLVFRPLYAVGGQDLGYLPGNESEKMHPWAQAVFDTLGALVSTHVVDEILDRGHARGAAAHPHPRPVAARRLRVVDEAQSLERNVLLTVLSRIGANSRVVLTHDIAQRDNLRVGRHDGVAAVVETLKGHPLFAHVTLTRSERSPDRRAGDRDAGGLRTVTAMPAGDKGGGVTSLYINPNTE